MWYMITLFSVFSSLINGQNLVIDLPEGAIAGHTATSFLGNTYYAFQEIPYAAPPVGDLRFRPPSTVEPWSGILNNSKITKQCFQQTLDVDYSITQTEDCLYLNVYTPQEPSVEHDLPVLVYIHGGGFVGSSAALYNPGRLIDYDVIVVTTNYRVGVFGFLTTMDENFPGNLGLKDQQFALRWVKSHISLFGGDPEKITICGESAGSVSVGYQLLGLNNEGLFRSAIQQSGSPLTEFSFTSNARTTAFNLGKVLDPTFDSESSEDLLSLLRSIAPEDIISGCFKINSPDDRAAGYLITLLFTPVVEGDDAENPFITASMHESFLNGSFIQVPILFGFNSEEALLFVSEDGRNIAAGYDADPSLIIDSKLNVPEENKSFVGEELKKFYTNSTFVEDQAAFVKYSSDAGFVRSTARQAELSSKYVPVYLYQFSFIGTIFEQFFNRTIIPGAEGAEHGEDMFYLWNFPLRGELHADDLLIIQRLVKLCANFVKYLNPTPNVDPLFDNVIWPAVQYNTDIQYLNINTTLDVRSNPRNYKDISRFLLKYIQPPYNVF